MLLVRTFEHRGAANNPAVDAYSSAMGIVVVMVGALSIARATAKAKPEVSALVLQGVRQMIDVGLGKPD